STARMAETPSALYALCSRIWVRLHSDLARVLLRLDGLPMPDRAALLIAVETFFEAAPPVPYAAADCAELHRALPAAGYNPAKCILVAGTRTTKAGVESHLRRLPKLIDKPDSLLVVIATRGFTHKNHGYLSCADTLLVDPAETSLAVADLIAALHKTKCKEI